MKTLITGCLLLLSLQGWCQTDTLFEENIRKLGDLMFGNLNTDLYGNSLINRSFSTSSVTQKQLEGDFSQIHGIIEFSQLYNDLALSYRDSSYMMSNPDLASFLATEFEQNEHLMEDDQLVVPFGFLFHNISYIDGSLMNAEHFSVSEYKLVPIGEEGGLYSKASLKSAAVIEFYPDNGYTKGYLKYVDELISVSPGITNLSLRVDLGTGYQAFETNSLLEFDRTADSVVGHVAFSYQENGIVKQDTIRFYVTTVGQKKSSSGWDYEEGYVESEWWPLRSYTIAVKNGCGNEGKKLRRPFIIIPPYRPIIQSVSMSTYYNQFNYAGIIDELSNRGYDVIFIKQEPGNLSLEQAGDMLILFIKYVNQKKAKDYPNESWENIIMGYSMGGQIARYALKKMEMKHMESLSNPHHHTRLYIPYDSPHHGANTPMFTQAVYYDQESFNLIASLSYSALTDAASKDMSIAHISGGNLTNTSGNIYTIQSAITSERVNFMNELNNNFNHQFTPIYDTRRSFPSFTRNIAVSTGSNNTDYNMKYSLYPGKNLYKQNTAVPTGVGFIRYMERDIYASKYTQQHTVFRIKELFLTPIPVVIRNRDYRIVDAYEWDMAQGGYKDEFYDKLPPGVGAVAILQMATLGIGSKLYKNHVSFLPLVSALAINPEIWHNNNVYYNLKTNGLMFNQFNSTSPSDLYGYPNLGHPGSHFSITPFEAIYCDPQIYEHIKMQASVDENTGYDDYYLETTRDFILDETEAADVYLQNKIIGKNHNQQASSYEYKAWYKAKNTLTIGYLVTPKTDPGDYVIEPTGNITVYAGDRVSLKPGFHSTNGSDFHAFIQDDCPYPKRLSSSGNNSTEGANPDPETEVIRIAHPGEKEQFDIRIFPNPSKGEIFIEWDGETVQELYVYSAEASLVYQASPENQTRFKLELKNGVYFCNFLLKDGTKITKKVIVL